jgi:hypothetical protein
MQEPKEIYVEKQQVQFICPCRDLNEQEPGVVDVFDLLGLSPVV